jgi:hypothetical protein
LLQGDLGAWAQCSGEDADTASASFFQTDPLPIFLRRKQDHSWSIPAFSSLNLEDGFAVAEFGPNLIIPAKGVPDEKSGNKNEDRSEDDDGGCEG